MFQVVNKHTHKATLCDVYIGRGSALGNPYPSKIAGPTKAEVIELYKVWLDEKIASEDEAVCDALNEIAYMVGTGHQVNLVCFCKPRDCHGDYVKEVILAKLKTI